MGAQRSASGRRLGHEAKRLRAEGTEVVLVQPMAEDLAVMGRNLMSGRRRNEVIETAERTVAEQLREPADGRELLREPPEGRAAQARAARTARRRAGRRSCPARARGRRPMSRAPGPA